MPGDRRRLVEKIKSRDIKALFIDECSMWSSTKKWIVEEVIPLVDYLWIVPSTDDLKNYNHQELSAHFFFVNFEQNFRNSRNVVKTTKSVAEKKRYKYKKGIAMPLGNFPGGCEPFFAVSFEEAVKEARKRTNEEILVIVDDYRAFLINNYYCDVLYQLNENGMVYHKDKNDFKEGGNPYKFLQGGNVLIIGDCASLGFDWPTVIVFEKDSNSITIHVCNNMLRCTTNLIVVKKP